MAFHKRKKVVKYRGSKTHGCGSMKKRRGAGNRGGRGNAGSGKRGDCKQPTFAKIKNYFGKHGFKKKNAAAIRPVNLDFFQQKLEKLVLKGLAEEKAGVFSVDLNKLKYNKLLGTGNLTKKVKFTVDFASQKAIEKVKKAGGEVVLPKAQKVETSKPEESAE